MKRIALASAALLAIVTAGCNPFGLDETRVYVNGVIYTDSTFSLPAEGVAVMVTGAVETYLTATDAAGMFTFEIQGYGSSGGVSPKGADGGIISFSVKALNGTAQYTYGGTGGTFLVAGGDTLNLYPVDLTMFKDKEEAETH